MKKLFVMFLLLALVPFTTGCSLFGDDNDDDTTLAITKLTASATLPAAAGAANLRAVAEAAKKFAKVTMKIGDITLGAVTEDGPDASGNYVVTFEKIVTTTEYAAATTGIIPVTIYKIDGTTPLVTFAMDYTTVTAPIAVTVSPLNVVTTTSGTVYAADKFVTVKSVAISTNTLNPTFTVEFTGDIGAITNPGTFDVKVVKGTTTVAASSSDFMTSYTPNTMTATLHGKTLVNGSTYTVNLNKIVSSTGIAVAAYTKTFTITLQ